MTWASPRMPSRGKKKSSRVSSSYVPVTAERVESSGTMAGAATPASAGWPASSADRRSNR